MDLVPGMMQTYAVVRDPEFNVAYWNLHAHELEHDGEHYTSDRRPLAFFHFSGFDPAVPHSLSRHQTRIKVEDSPALSRICQQYAAALEAEGYAEAKTWPYDRGLLPDGARFGQILRRLFAKGVDRGELHVPPFDDSGYEAFATWVTGRDEDSPPGITRLFAAIYEQRDDLQRVFPDLAGAHRLDYLRWVSEHAPAELDLPARLLQPIDASSPPARVPSPPPAPPAIADRPREQPLGVNVVGYFRSELGVGEAGRQVVSALDAVGIPLLPLHGNTIPLSRQGHQFTYLDYSSAGYPVNLVCMNADALPDFAQHAGSSFFADRYTIGLWFWEVTTPPPGGWKDAFALVDEVWVATHHVAQAVSSVAPVPVVRVPLPIELPLAPQDARELFGFSPDEFVFLFSFDYLSVFERKNPLGLVRAFTQALSPDSGARLVIKCINADHDPVHHERLQQAVADRRDIRLIEEYLSPEKKNALTAACDCFVSLHRAEGFGLTMAEAMFYGKPVIATAYSGNLDFMTPWNSYLVDHDLVRIGEGAPPYPADGVWADPSIEHAAHLIRKVFDDRDHALERGRRAAVDIRQSNSATTAGEEMAARLRRAPMATAAPESDAAFSFDSQSLAYLSGWVDRGPAASRAQNFPRTALRDAVLRIIKPFTAYQVTINGQILETLQDVQRALIETNGEWTEADTRIERRLDEMVTDQVRMQASYLRDLRVQAVERQNADERLSRLARRSDDLALRSRDLARRSDDLAWRMERADAAAHAIPFMDGTPFSTRHEPEAGMVLGYDSADGSAESDQYRSFEDVFRGSEDFIRERQRRYLPIIGSRQPVFDLGCGRGELLDLLRDAEIPFLGVDLDPGMVARCHEKGHTNVVRADGLDYLEEQPDGGLGVVFAAQVIEHMSEEQVRRLLALSLSKLASDGLLIAETVNPHSPPALKTFWVDLSHQQPVFPEVALELCREAGFASAYYFHPNGTGDVEQDRFVQGEYAVVASVEPGSQSGPPSASVDASLD